MKKHLWVLCLGIVVCILGSFGTVFAEDKAFFTTDKTTPLIGEPVELILHVRVPAQAKLTLPDFSNLGSSLFVKEIGSLNVVTQTNSETEYQLPLTVILWQVGQYSTPPLNISYQMDTGEPVNLTVESIQFEVPSTLNDNDLSLRPLKPQVNLPYFPIWTFAVALLVLVSISIIGVRYWFPRRRLQHSMNSPNDKWHPEANAALMSLKQLGQSTTNPSAIYVEGADCLRHYLDKRFALHTTDLTTAELLANLEAQLVIIGDQQQKLAEMLKRADLVKFAGMVPKLNAAQQYVSVAAEWIQSVEQSQSEPLI